MIDSSPSAQLVSVAVDESDPFLTVDEVAAMLRLNPQTVRNTIERGELAAVRVGPRRVRVRRSALDAWIAESGVMMGPSVEEAQAEFDAALVAVQAAAENADRVLALKRLARAATKLAGALPRR
jgi:excisionase family DNA binding protein